MQIYQSHTDNVTWRNVPVTRFIFCLEENWRNQVIYDNLLPIPYPSQGLQSIYTPKINNSSMCRYTKNDIMKTQFLKCETRTMSRVKSRSTFKVKVTWPNTLVPRERSFHKECTDEIWQPYHSKFKIWARLKFK